MYKVIRASEDYGVVVVVTPEDSKHGTPGAEYYICNENIHGHGATAFVAILEKEAKGYFSGLADGLGFGDIPPEPFRSLKDVENWMVEARKKFWRKRANESVDIHSSNCSP